MWPRLRARANWRPAPLAAGLAALALTACGGHGARPGATIDAGSGHDAAARADVAPRTDGAAATGPSHLTRLERAADFARLAGDGGEVKYLARVADRAAPVADACLFQDSRRFPYHVQFLRTLPGLAPLDFDSYLALVLRRESRVFWGGVLRAWPAALRPGAGAPGVVTFSVYADGSGDERLTADEIAQAYGQLQACAPFAAAALAFVPDGAAQVEDVRARRVEIEARGVPVLFAEDLRAGISAEGYSLGEGYGYLRVAPPGAPLGHPGPRDVLVTDSAPPDLSLVAGLVTARPQSALSHTNLRLREKKIPNGRLAGVFDGELLRQLDGLLVHLVVGARDVAITPARLEAAEAFWASRRPTLPPLRADPTVRALAPFATLRHADAVAYGAKAANLGELRRALPPANRVDGFGVPFARYAEFVAATGLAPRIDAVVADAAAQADAGRRRALLAGLRDALRAAPFPPALLAELRAAATAAFGPAAATTPLRFRSSTNAEDLEGLSGAGLYDSRRGCFADDEDGDEAGPSRCLAAEEKAALEGELARRRAERAAHPDRAWLSGLVEDLEADLAKEKPVADAVREVWASLWNARAWEDRAHWGLDHRKVYMGLAVNPSFVLEELEAVAVTGLRPDGGAPLYRVVSQRGSVGVVRPADPGAIAEALTFRRGPGDVPTDVTRAVASSLALPPGSDLWPPAGRATLASLLFAAHDHFARFVYPHLPGLQLDVEIELSRAGDIVLKQARPYAPEGSRNTP